MNIKYDFSLTGFILAIVVISMCAVSLSTFMTQMQNEVGLSGENSLAKYNMTSEIITQSELIENATHITQDDPGFLDIIGAYFRSGYSALQTTVKSTALFNSMMDDAASDIPEFAIYKTYLIAMIIIIISVGIGIAALLKYRI
jgi:hypothetical protein